VGYRHDRASLLAAAVDVALTDGLAELSFGRIAKRLGIADRTVVYYFPTKTDLVSAVVEQLATDLLAQLAAAFGTERRSRTELLERAWPVITSPAGEPAFRLYVQLAGLAAAGVEPFVTLAAQLLTGWHEWLVPLVDRPRVEQRRADAAALMAEVDGLLLLHLAHGPELSDAAFRRLVR
jgi:AcrR family transcriptional regulator